MKINIKFDPINTTKDNKLTKGLKSVERAKDDITRACKLWEDALKEINGSISVTFGFGDLPGQRLGNTRTIGDSIKIIFRNTPPAKLHHFDAGWWSRISCLDLFTLCLHELGHALGIHGEHTTRFGSIMSLRGPYSRFRSLPKEDIEDVLKIWRNK